MKKLAIAMAIVATLVGNGAFAQNTPNKTMNGGPGNKNMGTGAKNATYTANDNWAWGIGLGGLAVIGVVVGVTVAAAVQDGPTFSH